MLRKNEKQRREKGVEEFFAAYERLKKTAREATYDELLIFNGGKEIANTNEAVANAQAGDTITRNDGTEVTLTQGDIDWAKGQGGADSGSTATQTTTSGSTPTNTSADTGNKRTPNNGGNYTPSMPNGYNGTTTTSGTGRDYNAANTDTKTQAEKEESRKKHVEQEEKFEADRHKAEEARWDELAATEAKKAHKQQSTAQMQKNESIRSAARAKIAERDKPKVYFLYTYDRNSAKDQEYKMEEMKTIKEEKAYITRKGTKVIVNEFADKYDIWFALHDPSALMIVTSGHGDKEGFIYTADGKTFSPKDINRSAKNYSLKTVIFENCFQGGRDETTNDNAENWKKALGDNVDVVGWQGVTYVSETKEFNNHGFFDRQNRNLMYYCKNLFKNKGTLQ